MKIFGDVKADEVWGVLAMFLNLFLLLVAYYVIKVVREPLILNTGGAEMKAYAAGFQAFVLLGFVPLYSWIASKVDRMKLIIGVNALHVVLLQLFFVAALFEMPQLGLVFYIWVGVFSVSAIAQFWSFANEVYDKNVADRIFPIIAIGATVGAPVGSAIAALLFKEYELDPRVLMQISAGILILHTLMYLGCRRALGRLRTDETDKPLDPVGAFKLISSDRYLMLIAIFLIVLNLINTTGEYILSTFVVEAAEAAKAADASVDKDAFIGAFYGEFFSIVNVVTVVLQALIASRLTKRFGIAGVLFFLPVLSLGTYALVAAGIGLSVFRWVKTAENSVDYSFMNTAKAMMWLPTSSEAKYKAKQAVDTLFVRFGDVLSAGAIWLGTTYLSFGVREFAVLNIVCGAVFLGLAVLLYRKYQERADEAELDEEEEPALA